MLEEVVENILLECFINDFLLVYFIFEIYIYYNDELYELSIYLFLMYVNN